MTAVKKLYNIQYRKNISIRVHRYPAKIRKYEKGAMERLSLRKEEAI